VSPDATLEPAPEWRPTSADPNDEQFGDIVEQTTLTGADEYTATLVREPYDGGVIGTPGAREGPSAVCAALAGVKTHHFDAGPVQSVGDLGTIEVPPGLAVSNAQAAIREQTASIHEQETVPVFLGGDNSLTYANVAPLLEREESVGVISLDAHLDCRAVQGEPSSGTPYRQLWESGLDDMAVLGARHFETSTAYAEYLREQGGDIVTAEEVGDDPVEATDRALTGVEADHLYISVDVDVLDATAGPGVSAPTPGGITTRELFRIVRLLAGSGDVAGFEVVETAPPLCPDGRTPDAAARTVAHALSALETRARTGGESP
jgi:formimidoylglutamase